MAMVAWMAVAGGTGTGRRREPPQRSESEAHNRASAISGERGLWMQLYSPLQQPKDAASPLSMLDSHAVMREGILESCS